MGRESTWDGTDLPEHNHESEEGVEFKPRESDPEEFDTVLDPDEEDE